MFCVRAPYTLCTGRHFKPGQSLYTELLPHSVIKVSNIVLDGTRLFMLHVALVDLLVATYNKTCTETPDAYLR